MNNSWPDRRTCPSPRATASLSATLGSGTQKPERPAPQAGLQPARSSLDGTRRSAQLRLRRDRPRRLRSRSGTGLGAALSAYGGVLFSPSPERRHARCVLCSPRSVSTPAPSSFSRPQSHLAPTGTEGPRVPRQAAVLSGNHTPLFTPELGFHSRLSDNVMTTCVSLAWTSPKTWLYPSHRPSPQSPAGCLPHGEHSAHIRYPDKQINNQVNQLRARHTSDAHI